MLSARIVLGDCKQMLKAMESDSFDSMVTDPPAGIAFMGKAWDSYESLTHFQEDMTEVFKEAFRVMKPGAHGLVWALPRTSGYTMLALANAGFEVRDMVLHLFSSGMPKAKPDMGGEWAGWNTALKPAQEVWWLIRKPLSEKTVTGQVLTTGTGMINIDACRIASDGPSPSVKRREVARRTGHAPIPGLSAKEAESEGRMARRGSPEAYMTDKPGESLGRWPANLVFSHSAECDPGCVDGCPVNELGQQASDVECASRFFYTSKISPSERNLPDGTVNKHPTAKSIKLMRYFVRLVTPPGGTVLDPFAGSGTTGVAALQEGMSFVGVELDPEHHRVAQLRLDAELANKADSSLLDLALSNED